MSSSGSDDTTSFKLDDVWQLREQRFAEIGETEWGAICRHVQNVEQKYIEREGLMEPEVVKLVVSARDRSSSEDSSSSSSASGPKLTMRYTVSRNLSNSHPPPHRRRYSSYSFSTVALDGASGQRHAPAAL
jgi:hypothetical protein